MTDRDQLVDGLEACWQSLDGLLSGLDPEQWDTPSLCPDWTVFGVVQHLAAVEHMLVGWDPEPDSLPFDRVMDFLTETADLTGPELLGRYDEVIEARRRALGAMGEAEMAAPSMTPVGPRDYGKFMAVRIFDFWVHEQDMRVPLGIPGHESGLAAEIAIDEIEGSLGYIMGKKVALPEGMGITIDLTGGVQRQMHVAVNGRAKNVPSLDSPDVTLIADSVVFALLACGRIDPQIPIDDGRISWTGEAEIGERAARNLRYTM